MDYGIGALFALLAWIGFSLHRIARALEFANAPGETVEPLSPPIEVPGLATEDNPAPIGDQTFSVRRSKRPFYN